MKTIKFYLSFLFLAGVTGFLRLDAQRTFIFINQTNQTIWVGCQGNPLPANGGFVLNAGAQHTISVPVASSAIRFWGRTGCNASTGICETGECTRGIQCAGAGGIPPATLAEFTLDAAGAGNNDFYDVSLVDGYNLPIRIVPVPGTFTPPNTGNKYDCGIAGCTADLNLTCPSVLRVTNASGQTIACKSACLHFNTDQYCCRGAYGTPATCPPTNYSNIFKAACPDAYSYAYDDQTSTYVCKNATYQIIFGTGGTPPPPPPPPPPSSGVVTLYQHCSYGGYAVGLPVGSYTLSQLQSRGVVNDDVSSLRVQSGYRATLYQNNNFTGTTVVKTADDDCLVNDAFNDQTTSVVVASVSGAWTTQIQAESYSSMSGVQTETTTDAGGGVNVGWIEANDWMAYPAVTIPAAGTYTIEYRVASMSGGGNLQLERAGGSPIFGTLAVPSTGGWQTWTTIKHTVTLPAGSQSFAIKALAGGWNINWFQITQGIKSASDEMNELAKEMGLELYPNPVDETLNLDGLGENDLIEIFNTMGQKLMETKSHQIDVSELKPGAYILKVSSEGTSENKMFIKN